MAATQYDGSVKNANIPNASTEDSDGGEFGLFGQYRHALTEQVSVGLHLGLSKSSAAWKTSQTLPTGLAVNRVEADYLFDILGVVGFRWKQTTPFVMAGYSRMEVNSHLSTLDGDFNFLGDDSLHGWKVVAGVEKSLNEAWFWQVAVHYADYEDEIVQSTPLLPLDSITTFETQPVSLRFALGVRFR